MGAMNASEMFHWIMDSVMLIIIGMDSAATLWYLMRREWRSAAWFAFLGVTMAFLFNL